MTPAEVPDELVALASERLADEYGGHGWPGDEGARELLAAVLTRWEELRPEWCPYDCDGCHHEECPCDRMGCAGWVDPHPEPGPVDGRT